MDQKSFKLHHRLFRDFPGKPNKTQSNQATVYCNGFASSITKKYCYEAIKFLLNFIPIEFPSKTRLKLYFADTQNRDKMKVFWAFSIKKDWPTSWGFP